MRVKLTRHYNARRGATRPPRQQRSNGAQGTPSSPKHQAGGAAAATGQWVAPSQPGSYGSEPPPALHRPGVLPMASVSEKSFDPEASMRSDKIFGDKSFGGNYSRTQTKRWRAREGRERRERVGERAREREREREKDKMQGDRHRQGGSREREKKCAESESESE